MAGLQTRFEWGGVDKESADGKILDNIDEIEGQSAGGGSHLLHLMMNILGSELTGLITRAYNA